MSDGIMLVFGEDGVAREYDDTWDITIHCESEEEQKAVWEKLNNLNREVKNLTDTISRQAAIEKFEPWLKVDGYSEGELNMLKAVLYELRFLPPAQRTCVNCGRTVNNGGWYADGRTRCPIEEHYALPKDGYCHLWEKRNVTDDDYPERREE